MPTHAQLKALFTGDPMARIVAPNASQDDDLDTYTAAEESTAVDAPLVEGDSFQVMDVPTLGRSGFTHFLDGAQKSWAPSYYGALPFRLAHTSAALVARDENGCMEKLEPDCYSGETEAFVPNLEALTSRLGSLYTLCPIDPEPAETGVRFSERLRRAISDRREGRERDLASRFRDGWLLLDGGIGRICGPKDERQIVGLVKSHNRQYFASPDRTAAMLSMKAGQRSSAFLRSGGDKQGSPAYSFYLRLRESADQPPLYGVARIEVPARDALLDRVDEIAAWLLHERAPLSLPDPRYDRLLYPIRLVEQHLKARQPMLV